MYKGLSLIVVLIFVVASPVYSRPQINRQYPLRVQPEFDGIDISSYLKNERLVKLQINCVLFDGPCDAVGRWIKPRVKAGLLGECLACTKVQQGWMDIWLEKIIQTFPDLYRAAVAKFIDGAGVELAKSELEKINSTFVADFADSVAKLDDQPGPDSRQNAIAKAKELVHANKIEPVVSSTTTTTTTTTTTPVPETSSTTTTASTTTTTTAQTTTTSAASDTTEDFTLQNSSS